MSGPVGRAPPSPPGATGLCSQWHLRGIRVRRLLPQLG